MNGPAQDSISSPITISIAQQREEDFMDMNDMVIISVDDHISEPPEMFDKHLSGEDLATAPKLRTNAWKSEESEHDR